MDHIMNDHYVWSYLNFIIHLNSIDSTELNGTESYILDLYNSVNISWFPMSRSRTLEMTQERLRAAREAKQTMLRGNEETFTSSQLLELIEDKLNNFEEKVREIHKNIS